MSQAFSWSTRNDGMAKVTTWQRASKWKIVWQKDDGAGYTEDQGSCDLRNDKEASTKLCDLVCQHAPLDFCALLEDFYEAWHNVAEWSEVLKDTRASPEPG